LALRQPPQIETELEDVHHGVEVRNTFIDIGMATLQRKFQEIRRVRSCPGSSVGRLRDFMSSSDHEEISTERPSDAEISTESPSTPESVNFRSLRCEAEPAGVHFEENFGKTLHSSDSFTDSGRIRLSSSALPFAPMQTTLDSNRGDLWQFQQGWPMQVMGVVNCNDSAEWNWCPSQNSALQPDLGKENESGGSEHSNYRSNSATRRWLELKLCQQPQDSNQPPPRVPSVPTPPPPPPRMLASLQTDGKPISSLPTVGSAGHPVECKPCAFLHTKGCQSGSECQFCHLCGPGEKKKRQKVKKQTIQASKYAGQLSHFESL